jgi:hypothetical protein
MLTLAVKSEYELPQSSYASKVTLSGYPDLATESTWLTTGSICVGRQAPTAVLAPSATFDTCAVAPLDAAIRKVSDFAEVACT